MKRLALAVLLLGVAGLARGATVPTRAGAEPSAGRFSTAPSKVQMYRGSWRGKAVVLCVQGCHPSHVVKVDDGWLYVAGQTYPAEIESLYWGNDLTPIVRVYSQAGTDYFYLVEEYTLDKACTPTCCCTTYRLHKLIGNEAGLPRLPNGLVLRQSSS